jgi:Ca2+-binding RTX toxin-like protein
MALLRIIGESPVIVDARARTVTAADGSESSTFSKNVDWVIGAQGGDLLIADDSGMSLGGVGGDDTLLGGMGDDYLYADMKWVWGVWGEYAGVRTVPGPAGYNWLSGGAGDDHLVGGYGSDALYGGPGNDHLSLRNYGPSVLYGQGGNDTLHWEESAIRLDGGRGRDQLDVWLEKDLDLREVSIDKLIDIEIINLASWSRYQQLTLTRKDVLDMSSTTDTLTVLGDRRGDSVEIVGPYRDLGVSGAFHRYKLGDAMLLVDTDIKDVG